MAMFGEAAKAYHNCTLETFLRSLQTPSSSTR